MKKEIWKEIQDFPDYQISNLGRIRSSKFGKVKIMKQSLRDYRYLAVTMYCNGKGFNKKTHRLVAEAFIPNPDNLPEVDHIDGDKLNNTEENLRWVNSKENKNNPNTFPKLLQACEKNSKRREVQCIETGEIFKSCRDADRFFNLRVNAVLDAANPKHRQQTAGGYHWKFI